MGPEASSPTILLLHDGELRDVRALLTELEIPFVDRTGDPTDVDQRTTWDLVVASHKRIRKFHSREQKRKTTRIAILDSDSKTLRSMMQRIGVDFIVVRPVHASALRLLILHVLYRGPERRRDTRVSIGAGVSIRSGLFKRDAILTDLSLRGCRLLTTASLQRDKKIKVTFPASLAGDRAYTLGATVRRVSGARKGEPAEVAVAFLPLSPAEGRCLRKTYEHHSRGPARLAHAADKWSLSAAAAQDAPSHGERRSTSRHRYAKRVVALGDEATRVLLCRDISMGGMRVEANDTLVAGDALRIALHAGPRTEPLIVYARVARDEGEKGLILTFRHLSDADNEYLTTMIDRLPIAAAPLGDDDGEGVVVSEIVERIAG